MNIKRQLTSHVMMVRPSHFGFNEETASNNAFQTRESDLSSDEISKKAKDEFDRFVDILRKEGINVHVMDDSKSPIKPDAVFPNNWISMHEDGTIIQYPMYAKVRRKERDQRFIEVLKKEFKIVEYIDLSPFENHDLFLEGTGSLIFDHPNELVYACLSVRTNVELLRRLAKRIGYKPIFFTSVDENDVLIYHTNVMMAVGDQFIVICLDTIKNDQERAVVVEQIESSWKELIEISLDQMNQFAGNMIQLKNDKNESFLVMSEQAHLSLNTSQIKKINKYCRILSPPIYTIEQFGGGSARCMIAEIFLPKR